MDRKMLESTWRSRMCNTVQEYLQATLGTLDQTGCSYGFRGVTRHFNNLRSSIDRRKTAPRKCIKLETWLLEEFLHRAWNDLTLQERQRCLIAETRWGSKRNTGSMVVARHRMVPTRCIDWTSEPLCALLFACEKHPKRNGDVWWFNRTEFDYCVGAQWPRLFGKRAHVVADIEKDFIEGRGAQWITALNYMRLPGDRLDCQKAWITVVGHLGACHAEEIHNLGVREKGRLVIPAKLKANAMGFLRKMGITRESLGFPYKDPADKIAAQLKKEFTEKLRSKS
jgi:hypothetical protein